MLSVCIIARNEQSSLPRALQSVRAIADEIIVTDTGSTDRTEQIARDNGAIVHKFAWCDDFSAARNFTIEQAHGEWILWLDADEELLPESIPELRSSIGRQNALAFLLRRQDLQRADQPNYFSMMWQLRLFRRREDLRFLGRCHPHFVPEIWAIADKTGLAVEESSITLRHYGYVGELKPAKLQRGARLLQLELQDRPGQLYYQIEYGRTLLMLGNEEGHDILGQAASQLRPRIDEAEAPEPIVGQLLEHLLLMPPERLPEGFDLKLVEKLVWRWFPRSPPLLWLLARRAAETERYAEAEQLLRRLLEMGKNHSYDMAVSFNPGFVGGNAQMNLAVCLLRQGSLTEARSMFQDLQANSDFSHQARANLELIDRALQLPATNGISYSFPTAN